MSPSRTTAVHAAGGGARWRSGSQVLTSARSAVVPLRGRLAHVVQNRIEAACARSELFERRRLLINDWAQHLSEGRGQVVTVASLSQPSRCALIATATPAASFGRRRRLARTRFATPTVKPTAKLPHRFVCEVAAETVIACRLGLSYRE